VDYSIGQEFKCGSSLQGMSPPGPEADRGCGQFKQFHCKNGIQPRSHAGGFM